MSALGAKMYELVRTVKARLDIPFALRLVARRMPRQRHLPDGAALSAGLGVEIGAAPAVVDLAWLVRRPARRPTIASCGFAGASSHLSILNISDERDYH
jgi:hypothetical protein